MRRGTDGLDLWWGGVENVEDDLFSVETLIDPFPFRESTVMPSCGVIIFPIYSYLAM